MAKRIIGIVLTVLGGLGLIGSGITFFILLLATIFFNIGLGEFDVDGNTSFTTGEVDYVGTDYIGVYYETDDGWYYGEMPLDLTGTLYYGDYVTVEYETTNPENFTITEVMDALKLVNGIFIVADVLFGIFTLLGLLMTIVGIILIVSAAKKKKAMTPSYM